ncbi:MAG: hypothetical protein U9R79_05880, partial [Armatimonadota bacterium]|nr:hypothetical protein [Armatimonadota bacterium]
MSDGQLAQWEKAVEVCHDLPGQFRDWESDEATYEHLQALAMHPADALRVPAAVALALLSRLPPAPAMQAVMAHRDAGDLWRYVNGPLR